jgi:hypothetical protein
LALNGTQIINKLRPLSLSAREDTIFNEFKTGNVPDFMRTLSPVHDTVVIQNTTYFVTYFVTPDYLALGSDSDYFLCPMTPLLAQKICDYIGFSMPTRKMSNTIWKNAKVKMNPQTIPPSSQMTTIPVFAKHDSMVWAQRQTFLNQNPLGALVAGDKKDVVISNLIYSNTPPGRVVIYGWHYPNGTPIQPLYNGHDENYADYSHGIRLVQNEFLINGCMALIQDVLKSSTLSSLLSDEGIISNPRYPVTPINVSTPNLFGVFSDTNNQLIIRTPSNNEYNICLSTDGKCFNLPIQKQGDTIILSNLQPDSIYFVKIAAIGTNGGKSTYSEVLGATLNNNPIKYLIINGFDRNTNKNTHDYVIQHAQSLQAIGRSFHSITNEAWINNFTSINNYNAVDFILGEESSANETFSDTEQQLFTLIQIPYFISGSEIGWDLDHLGSTTDKDFYHNYLHAQYVEDAPNNQASTYYNGIITAPYLTNLSFMYDNGTQGTYDVRYPDVVAAISPAQSLGYFSGFPSKSLGTFINNQMVYLTIPFECIYPKATRDSVMQRIDNILLSNPLTAFNTNHHNNILLFPNPASYTINVLSTTKPITEIEIYNLLAQKIVSITNYSNQQQLSIPLPDELFTTGIYVIKIKTADNHTISNYFNITR